ncbi:hypothetical protein Aduo_019039 [Ancylostoma duodenale]
MGNESEAKKTDINGGANRHKGVREKPRGDSPPLVSCFKSSLVISSPIGESTDPQLDILNTTNNTQDTHTTPDCSPMIEPDLGGTWAEHMQNQEPPLFVNEVKNESESTASTVLHETSATATPTEVSITDGHAVLRYDHGNTTKTAATSSTPPIRDEPMDISEVAEPVDPRDKAFKQSDDRMRAIIALLEDSGQGYPNTGSNQPLRPNPSVTSITPCPKVTNFTTLQTEPRTVEELTAENKYVHSSSHPKNLHQPDQENTMTWHGSFSYYRLSNSLGKT